MAKDLNARAVHKDVHGHAAVGVGSYDLAVNIAKASRNLRAGLAAIDGKALVGNVIHNVGVLVVTHAQLEAHLGGPFRRIERGLDFVHATSKIVQKGVLRANLLLAHIYHRSAYAQVLVFVDGSLGEHVLVAVLFEAFLKSKVVRAVELLTHLVGNCVAVVIPGVHPVDLDDVG